MKRIALIISISLVMCLTMSFPASAAKYTELNVPSYPAFYNTVIQRANTAGYTYIAFFYNSSMSVNFAIASKTKNVVNGTEIIRYQQSTGGGNFYANGSSATFTNFTYSGGAINIPLNSSGQIVNYNSYYYFPEISTIDFSSISATYCRTLTNIAPLPAPSALQALLTQAKAKTNTGYTQSSWQALQTQITAAENLLATTGYTQEQINSATVTLQSALDGLTLLPDSNGLDALLLEAETIENIGYTLQSWSRLQSAISSARFLALGADYTQSELDTVMSELRAAMNGLTLNVVTPPDPPPKPPAQLGYDLSTGDVSGYLNVVPKIFYNYVLSAKPAYLLIFGIVLAILLVPRLIEIIIPTIKR